MSCTRKLHQRLKMETPLLSQSPIETKRSDSPGPSCVSMRSDASMDTPMVFKDGDPSSELSPLQRSDTPEPSMVSMRSDASMNPPMVFKDEDLSSELSLLQIKRSDSPEPSCVSMRSDASMNPPMVFKDPSSEHSLQEIERSDSPGPSCVSRRCNKSMNPPMAIKDEDPSSEHRHGHTSDAVQVQENFRAILKERFQCLNEVITNQGNPTLLNEIYTELYITEGDCREVNNKHEVRQIEAASRRTTEDTPIKCNDIFKPFSEQDKPIRTVLTKGVAGIGKTVSVQKFILDWAEDKAHQDLQFIFPLPFRELNLMKNQRLSLLDLLHKCVQETEIETSSLHKALFVFDGLDECRLPLDFQSSESVCDVTESASVDVLLINLIKGNLLPSALIWITSRPAAADQIPSEYVDRVTEVRGFNDPQKEEYFRRRISDEDLANRIISHLKTSRSLYIMCHIPVFCWISATVLERLLGEAESGEIPKTLTQMYTHFLIIQTQIIREKYTQIQNTDEEILLKLGHLAFQQLMRGNLIFYEEDLRECGIHVQEASVYSGVCTQIFREESGLLQSKVYCFIHLSVQEHFAALYVHMTFMIQKTNLLRQMSFFSAFDCIFRKETTIVDVHKSAVDQALKSRNGHLDLFVRFLLGLSVESCQSLLPGLVTQTVNSSYSTKETVQYVKKKIRENPSAEKFINLFHCLSELGDRSLIKEIQSYLKSGNIGNNKLSSSQWSAVVFVLLTSEENLSQYVLQKFGKSEKILRRMMPVVSASRTAWLNHCKLTKKSCTALASVLSSESTSLRDVELSKNKLGDSGVKILSDALKNPHCKLETLWLWRCKIKRDGCEALASALKSQPSHLKLLDLSGNKLKDSGMKQLSAALKSPHCTLETLRLKKCKITDEGCAALGSALKAHPSHLRKLNLSINNLGESGLKHLSDALENPRCKLQILKIKKCWVEDKGCGALASALKSNPSHLRVLDLSGNELGNSGLKLLCEFGKGLNNPQCRLEKLRLHHCNITDEGCGHLASALNLNPSHLRELNLSANKLGDSGVTLLSSALKNPLSKLKILRLQDCNIRDEGCTALAGALKSRPSHLRELDLSLNKLGNSGVRNLSTGLEKTHCKLKILRLRDCNITDGGCAALSAALNSNPSHLRVLDLITNSIWQGGNLIAYKNSSNYELQELRIDEISLF